MDFSNLIPFARLTFFLLQQKMSLDSNLKASAPSVAASVAPLRLLSLQFLVIRKINAYVLFIPYYKESLRLYLTSFINVFGTFCSKASLSQWDTVEVDDLEHRLYFVC
jgi:hypothetical protein